VNSGDIDVIWLSAEVGGPDASLALNEHILALRKLLRAKCKGPYSSIIEIFDFSLVINGSVLTWRSEDASKVGLQRKKTLAVVDIFFPHDQWVGCDFSTLRANLAAGVLAAVEKLPELAEKKKG